MAIQKKGFLLFICSLVPGAGELYMGFKRRGVSMMAVFWGIVAVISMTGFAWLSAALPIVWAYSFFQVHNLKSMPEEVFYLQRDEYAFHFEYVLKHKGALLRKYRIIIAAILIVSGLSVLFSAFGTVLYYLIPFHMVDSLSLLIDIAKNAVAAIVFLGGGIYLAMNKEKWQSFLEKEE